MRLPKFHTFQTETFDDEKHGECRNGYAQLSFEGTKPRSCSRSHPFQNGVGLRPPCSCHKNGSLRWQWMQHSRRPSQDCRRASQNIRLRWHNLLTRDSSNSSCAASHSMANWMMDSALTFSRNEVTLALTFGLVLRWRILGKLRKYKIGSKKGDNDQIIKQNKWSNNLRSDQDLTLTPWNHHQFQSNYD